MHLLKLHIDAHIIMSMCTYAAMQSSKLDYPLQMSQAAHCLPRHQTWAGYTGTTATRTDVRNILYAQHYI